MAVSSEGDFLAHLCKLNDSELMVALTEISSDPLSDHRWLGRCKDGKLCLAHSAFGIVTQPIVSCEEILDSSPWLTPHEVALSPWLPLLRLACLSPHPVLTLQNAILDPLSNIRLIVLREIAASEVRAGGVAYMGTNPDGLCGWRDRYRTYCRAM